ncbi:TetR/AcrR family transcriptional regulator [Streptomyces sp. NBC_01795]|uniref:TetR/AcrR family transcriptional regulator n=1 Tax=Streptomyces sp. NBC_01795 TaxID=2975943 RepID=UPI002DDA70DE|nr:TetR/AcrR family transcriptional regulator [Streptomyces sp. NBC_01795]WSA96050.1 TetR/AcrR family transcriptional regulator [Streptomyces sp. NBC_01795]
MAPSASSERGKEVRQQLLRAAAELIAELGWPAVSTRVLATRAGVGPGLVHYHFASLQALLTEAALGVMRGLADELTALLDQVRSPEEGLELIVGGLGGHDPQDPTSRLFSEAYLAATRDAELRHAIGELIVEFRRPLALWLAEHDVPEPEATAAVLAAALDGIMLHRALSPGLTAEDITRVLRRLLLAPDPR